LLTFSIDSRVELWNRDGIFRKRLPRNGDSFISLSFNPDGNILAVNSDDKIRLWNQDGTLLMVLKGEKDELTSISFSPDGKTLGAASGNRTIILRSLSDIKLDFLIKQGCELLKDYLENYPQTVEIDRSLCSNRL
jgi:WD40 repeat protein